LMARAQTPTDIIWRALQGSEADRQTRNDRHLAQRLLAALRDVTARSTLS